MFDFLKKKISEFVDKIASRQEEKAAEKKAEAQIERIEEKVAAAIPEAKKAVEEHEKKVQSKPAKIEKEHEYSKHHAHAAAAHAEKKPKPFPPHTVEKKAEYGPAAGGEKNEKIEGAVAIAVSGQAKSEVPSQWKEQNATVEPAKGTKAEAKCETETGGFLATIMKGGGKKPGEKKEEKVKLSLATQVKSIFSSEVELSEKDISSALDDFEMELLEGDVAFEVAEQIKDELRNELVGSKMKKSELQQKIESAFFNSIKEIMSENTGMPILEQVKRIEARPVKIMFTGPNGSGKTTTIAKIANLLKKNGYTVVIAAADTFRAAAIEQMEIHGSRLGIKVVKGKYGADPTSVAFDAVSHAKAHNMDVVLIDTAGRQETNLNLLNELKKMVRVLAPEIKVYVGESIAGNSVIEQVDTFNRELGLDGVILTKLDCDAKGGTVISISKVTKVPVLYVTVGQGYEDIEEFDADRIAHNIAG